MVVAEDWVQHRRQKRLRHLQGRRFRWPRPPNESGQQPKDLLLRPSHRTDVRQSRCQLPLDQKKTGLRLPVGYTHSTVKKCSLGVEVEITVGGAVSVIGVTVIGVTIIGVTVIRVAVFGVTVIRVTVFGVTVIRVAVVGVTVRLG